MRRVQVGGKVAAVEVVGECDPLRADTGELLAAFGDDLVFVLGREGEGFGHDRGGRVKPDGLAGPGGRPMQDAVGPAIVLAVSGIGQPLIHHGGASTAEASPRRAANPE